MQHILKRIALAFANLIASILPPTRFYHFKRNLFRISGCKIDNGVKLVGGAKIHYSNVFIGKGTWVGSNVHLYCSQQGTIIIGKNNDIAPFVLINTGTHEIGSCNRRAGKNIGKDIFIGNGCWIGMGVSILSGSIIGNGCVVAAGSVVRGEYPDNVLIAGVPAEIKKQLN